MSNTTPWNLPLVVDSENMTFKGLINRLSNAVNAAMSVLKSGLPKETYGRTSYGTVGAGAAVNVDISFPAGLFTDASKIRVTATPANARLSTGVEPTLTTLTSARISLGNWSGGGAGASTVDWRAVQEQ